MSITRPVTKRTFFNMEEIIILVAYSIRYPNHDEVKEDDLLLRPFPDFQKYHLFSPIDTT